MDNSNIGLGVAPQQQPQQPIQTVNDSARGTTSQQPVQPSPQLSQDKSNPKKKKTIVAVSLIAVVVAVAATLLVVFMITQPNKVVGLEDVRDYCNQHNLTLNGDSTMALCTGSDTTQLLFAPYDKNDFVPDNILSSGAIELENNDEYKKYFARVEASNADIYYYTICDNNNCLSVAAASNDAARKAIIEIGYPDRNWPSEKDQQSAANASLKVEQRNTARRNDIARINTALIQYETNNSGKLPSVSDTWTGAKTFNCAGSTASACQFVQRYMNSAANSSQNTFMDPDGTLYNLNIQSASTWSESEKRNIIQTGKMDYTIYIVTSAICSNGQAQKSTARHFAIFYQMENADVYCHDGL